MFKKILVPTDFSPAAAEAFRTAVSLARTGGGEVVVAHVTHEVVVAGRASAAGALEMLEKFGCDLIVIGSHGHGRLRLFRRSLTDEVVRHAHCPVLVVKAPTTPAAAPAKPVAAQAGRTA